MEFQTKMLTQVTLEKQNMQVKGKRQQNWGGKKDKITLNNPMNTSTTFPNIVTTKWKIRLPSTQVFVLKYLQDTSSFEKGQ